MQKKMGCKADGEDETAAALTAVRISSNRPTQQTAFSAPRQYSMTSKVMSTSPKWPTRLLVASM